MNEYSLIEFRNKNFSFLAPEEFSPEYMIRDGKAGFVLYNRDKYNEYNDSDCYVSVTNMKDDNLDGYIDEQLAIHGYDIGFSHDIKALEDMELRLLNFEGKEDYKKYIGYFIFDYSRAIELEIVVKNDTDGANEFKNRIYDSFLSTIDYQKEFDVSLSDEELAEIYREHGISLEQLGEQVLSENYSNVELSSQAGDLLEQDEIGEKVEAQLDEEKFVLQEEFEDDEEEVPQGPVELVEYTTEELEEQLYVDTQKFDEKLSKLKKDYQTMQDRFDELTKQERELMNEKTSYAQELSKAGIFSGNKKKNLQTQVSQVDDKLLQNKKDYEEVRAKLASDKIKINKLKKEEELMQESYRARMLFKEGEEMVSNQDIINDIHYVLVKAKRAMNEEDIRNSSELLAKMDDRKFITLLRSMMVEDKIEKIEKEEEVVYQLIK